MNAELLLQHFEHLSEAPDAIPRLRRFILDLAVRGKLVEQDPNDESAAAWLKRLAAKRAQLFNSGEIRKDKLLPPIPEDALPFELPSGWAWERLGNIGETNIGLTYSPQDISEQGTPVLRSSNIQNGRLDFSDLVRVKDKPKQSVMVQQNDLLICARNGSRALVGKVAVIEGLKEPAAFGAFMAIFRSEANRYLYHFICSALFRQVIAEVNTTTINQITQNNLRSTLAPIPPHAEQHRIVARVDELMALCDQLEAAQAERESRRDRLVASSLNGLNNGTDAGGFREHARFYFNHLPRLTTKSEHIQQLRQTILSLAVRGKLVPQDPNDEPAAELLNRIQAEKAVAVKEGEIKKIDSVDTPSASHFPSELPAGWEPAYLQSLCISVTDGDHLPPPQVDHGIPFLVIGDVRSQTITFKGCRYVAEEYYDGLDSIRRPKKGDVLYTLVGSYGIPVMVTDDRQFCVQRHIGILRPSKNINAGFLNRALESKWVFNQATACATGIAQKTVPLSGLRKILVPLPPVAEQQRIVAKVDELMALCDQLETQLNITETDSRRLLEAAVHEAVAHAQGTTT